MSGNMIHYFYNIIKIKHITQIINTIIGNYF
jgi:hypothetical protein